MQPMGIAATPSYWLRTKKRRRVTPTHPSLYRAMAGGLAGSCALRGGIHGVERLARGHEQAVALGAAEADVAAHLGQADAAEELAVRRPYRHAAIAHGTAGIARAPDIAVDVAAHAVRTALHAVNHEVAEPLV